MDDIKYKLIELAKSEALTQNEAVELALVASGDRDPYLFLDDIIKGSTIGDATLPYPEGTEKKYIITISSRIKGNKARREQLKNWIDKEPNPDYRDLYQRELDVIDEYTQRMLLDILENKAQLEEDGKKALKEKAQRKKIAAEKKAQKQ